MKTEPFPYITYIVRVERMRREYAEIPVVARSVEEARQKAWSKRSENCHAWRTFESSENIADEITAGHLATEWQIKCEENK